MLAETAKNSIFIAICTNSILTSGLFSSAVNQQGMQMRANPPFCWALHKGLSEREGLFMSKGKSAKFFGKGLTCCAVAGAMVALSCGVGFGATASQISADSTPVTVTGNELTTMGARAGSAGPDFLGISNMNYDFQPSHSAGLGDPYPYYASVEGVTATGYKADMAKADHFNRLAIWGSAVNTNPNPYYQNLLADCLLGTAEKGGLPDGYTAATTYHSNKNSWGDVVCNGASVISASYTPDIIFGANKTTNWSDGDIAAGTYAKAAASEVLGYDPTYSNNDSTNIWTQIYTLQQLAADADKTAAAKNKTLRYGDASDSALAYEKSIKGQMLYVASQIDQKKVAKKKVAYLYAIDTDANKAYFYVPTADGLTTGSDTGAGKTATDKSSPNQDVYASNNSVINMGYMATLPFITDTFGASKGEGTVREGGIQMLVEDIYKKSPVVEVTSANANCLKDVDLIIYNSSKLTGTAMHGENNGKCVDEDVINTSALTDDSVTSWAKTFGFSGSVLAGDDWGTSNQQNSADSVGVTTGSAPMMYCARNYTVDKNVRAAWAFSKVYPELYGNNDDASYAYWLENVYHIKNSAVKNVLANYTHQNESTVDTYGANNTSKLNSYAQIGYNWYKQTAGTKYTKTYAYYNGSSRASYYSCDSAQNEPKNTIGIFEPSTLWTSNSKAVLKAAKAKVKVKKGKKVTVKISGAKKAVKASVAKKSGLKLTVTKKKLTVKAPKKTAKKGTYTVTLKSSGAVKTTVKVVVK